MKSTTRTLRPIMAISMTAVMAFMVAGSIASAQTMTALAPSEGRTAPLPDMIGVSVRVVEEIASVDNATAMLTYEVIGISNDPIYLREEQYLDLEAEGHFNQITPQLREGSLQTGVWQNLFPNLYQQEHAI